MASKKKEVRVAMDDLTKLRQRLNQFRDLRLKTIQELENLLAKAKEEEACKHHGRNSKIAVVSGSSAAVAGGVLAVVGFGLSFVTFGTSLILTGVGAGVAGVGGLTVAGTRMASYFLNREHYKEVKKAIDKERENSKKLLDAKNKTLSSLKEVKRANALREFVKQLQSCPVLNGLAATKILGKNILYDTITTADMLKGIKTSAAIGRTVTAGADAALDASGSVFKSLSTVGRVLHIGGFAVTVIVLPMDIYTLVTESIRIHKGRNDVEEKIEGLIEKLKIPEDFVERCLNELLNEVF